MLFVLGVGSLVALQGCANVVIMDALPSVKIWQVTITTAVIGFLVGLVYVTPVRPSYVTKTIICIITFNSYCREASLFLT